MHHRQSLKQFAFLFTNLHLAAVFYLNRIYRAMWTAIDDLALPSCAASSYRYAGI